MELLIWKKRNEINMKLEELSRLTGISTSALSNYENGLRYPNMKQIAGF
jgi:transcriptional regulator with XRE-family HTH domain